MSPAACLRFQPAGALGALAVALACQNAQPPESTNSGSAVGNASTTGGNVGSTTGGPVSAAVGATTTASNTSTVTGNVTSSGTGSTGSTGSTGTTGGMPSTVVPGAEGFNCEPADGSPASTRLTKLVGGLEAPTGVYGAPGETDRLFLTLQGGRIEILRGTTLTTFLDLTDLVDVDEENQHEERGLLGMAFHPQFQQNGKFFVNYTRGNALEGGLSQYVSEFTATGDTANADSERIFTQISQGDNNHNGGGLAIGLDGYLYVAVGDGGFEGLPVVDQYMNAQNPNTPLGAILRYTLDGSPAPGNLPGASPEVWDIGLRNPWRISFDGCTGDLYISDVGFENENDSSPPTEEVNVEPPMAGHKNYGWPVMEGDACRDAGCDASQFVIPVDSYVTIDGGAIIGGHVYRGSAIPSLRGTYIYADYGRAIFRAFEYAGGVAGNSREITSDINPNPDIPFEMGNIISFGQDSRGEMYVIAWTNGGDSEAPATVGDLYRIDPE